MIYNMITFNRILRFLVLLIALFGLTQCEEEDIIVKDCSVKGSIYVPGLSSEVVQVSFQNIDNPDETHVVSVLEEDTFYIDKLYLTRYRVDAYGVGYSIDWIQRQDISGRPKLRDFVIDFSKNKHAEIFIKLDKADGKEEYCDISVLDLDDNSLSAFYIKKTASIFEFKLRSKFTSGLVLSEFNISSDCRLKYGNKSIPLFSLITPQKGQTNYVLDTLVQLYINPEIQKYINEPGVTLINPTITIGKGLELPIYLYD